jgi:hypothetical protein
MQVQTVQHVLLALKIFTFSLALANVLVYPVTRANTQLAPSAMDRPRTRNVPTVGWVALTQPDCTSRSRRLSHELLDCSATTCAVVSSNVEAW